MQHQNLVLELEQALEQALELVSDLGQELGLARPMLAEPVELVNCQQSD